MGQNSSRARRTSADEQSSTPAKSLLSISRKARQKARSKGKFISAPSTEPLAIRGMNPRFPVESGESLSAAVSLPPQSVHKRTTPEEITNSQQLPVWVYVIFRKNPSSGHDKVNIKDSLDGPVFWTRRVLYVFCCSCHFDRHERDLLKLLEQWKSRVERVCLVDRPLDYPFLPDSLFGFLANHLPRLEFVYLRELDLERINRATVERLSQHRHLKKLIVHGCRNYEALQDFHNLPQLLVVKGDIQGLKVMLGCDEPGMMDESSTSDASMKNGNHGNGKEEFSIRNGI